MVPLPIVGVDRHAGRVDAAELPLEERLPVHRLAHDDFRAPAGKAPVVVGASQRPIQSRRRNLERVRGRHHVVDVEQRAQVAADVRAILDAHAVFGRRRRTGPIDLDPEHHPAGFAPKLHLEQLEPVARGDASRHRPHLVEDIRLHLAGPASPETKKVGTRPLGPYPRLRIQNYSTGFATRSYSRAPTISTSTTSPARMLDGSHSVRNTDASMSGA